MIEHPLPFYMSTTFTASCEFWALASPIVEMYYANRDAKIVDRIPLLTVESAFQRLLEWADRLPKAVSRGWPPHHHTANMQSVTPMLYAKRS